jgi:hypothetical protein
VIYLKAFELRVGQGFHQGKERFEWLDVYMELISSVTRHGVAKVVDERIVSDC